MDQNSYQKSLEKWRRRHLGEHDLVRRMDRQGEVFDMAQKVFGIREAKNGAKTDELLRWAPKKGSRYGGGGRGGGGGADINVNDIEKERWVTPWWITTGMPSVRRCVTASMGEDWGEFYDAYKEMSRAVGVKKPQEAQKAKALWKMKAAKEAGDEYFDPTREDNIQGRSDKNSTWEEHLKNPIFALDKALKCVENSCWAVWTREPCGGSLLQWPVLAFLRSLWEKPIWEDIWP